MWSLRVLARSYWTFLALAVLIALWAVAAYEWLGLPESSGLLLILALLWAIVQLLVAVAIIAGSASGAAETAAADGRKLPLRSLWAKDLKSLLSTLILCLVSFILVLFLGGVFNWINNHSVEVASFLTFHSEKPVSHVLIEKIYWVIEGLLWVVLSGFLLSFLTALVGGGWAEARKQGGKLLAGCLFRTPFLTSLLSVVVSGGLASVLSNWHPVVPPGFWDYTQVIARFSLVSILLAAGWSFWLLSLARLHLPAQENS
jgi:magnesium-transporting ATPase (P-type)